MAEEYVNDSKGEAGRGPLFFIFITVMINSMGIGLIMPVMPDLLQDLLGGADTASIALAAAWGGWITMSFALMQFLFSPTLGNLSDRFGRRPVLLISLAVMCVDYIVMALTPTLALLLSPGSSQAYQHPPFLQPTPLSLTSRRRKSARRTSG